MVRDDKTEQPRKPAAEPNPPPAGAVRPETVERPAPDQVERGDARAAIDAGKTRDKVAAPDPAQAAAALFEGGTLLWLAQYGLAYGLCGAWHATMLAATFDFCAERPARDRGFATLMLANQGADVVKIEQPDYGDALVNLAEEPVQLVLRPRRLVVLGDARTGEPGGEEDPAVRGDVGGAGRVEDDARRGDGLLGVVLLDGHLAADDVEDVRGVVVFVRAEFGARAEREVLDEHVVRDDEFPGQHFPVVRRRDVVAVERHTGPSGGAGKNLPGAGDSCGRGTRAATASRNRHAATARTGPVWNTSPSRASTCRRSGSVRGG